MPATALLLTRRPPHNAEEASAHGAPELGELPHNLLREEKTAHSEGTESPLGGQGRPEAICKVSTNNHSALGVITGPSWLLDAVQVVVLKDVRSHNH